MAKAIKTPKYIVQVDIEKKLRIHVTAGSGEDAVDKAKAALKEQLEKSGIDNFEIQAFCNTVVVDKNNTYVEAINLYNHPDITSVGEYIEGAGLFRVAAHESVAGQFAKWLAEQPSFKLFDCDITLVRVGQLWTALISVADPKKVKLQFESLEEKVANFLAQAKTLPTGSTNPAKGSVPVPAGFADAAARLVSEVFQP